MLPSVLLLFLYSVASFDLIKQGNYDGLHPVCLLSYSVVPVDNIKSACVRRGNPGRFKLSLSPLTNA
jgi:hypothetical protein